VSTNLFSIDTDARPRTERNDDGTAVLTRLPVFKTGEFTSNNGKRKKYTSGDLQAIASNFKTLKEGVLPNVPVRANHGQSVNEIVGYHDRLYVEGDVLYADITFTEPEAAGKWDRGTYRNRSSEIGAYTTNEGEEFDLAFVGMAFVDLPAVEGLDNHYSLARDTGDTVFTQEDLDAARKEGVDEGYKSGHTAGLAEGAATAASAFSAPQGAVTKFSLNGSETDNAEEIQAHIAGLEETVAKFSQDERRRYVEGLAEDNKILASKVDETVELVSKFDAAGFENFKAIYSNSVELPQFQSGDTGNEGGGSTETKLTEMDRHLAVVDNFRKAGLTEAQIEQSSAYQKIQRLKAQEA